MELDLAYSDLTYTNLARLASTVFQLRAFAHALPTSLPVSGCLFFDFKFFPYRVA